MFEKSNTPAADSIFICTGDQVGKAFEILANNLIEGAHDIPLMKRGFAQLFAEFFNNR